MFRKADRAKPAAPSQATATTTSMSAGQLAYEARRAADAGMTVEAWLTKKTRDAARAASEKQRAATAASPKPKGMLSRLLDRAHKPLG